MMQNQNEFYKQKIKAFLHDPPEKALMLFEKIEGGHVGRSLQYIKTILREQLSDIPADIKSADHVASACDRINLPGDYKEYGVDFLEQPEMRHPLSGSKIELEPMKSLDLERVFETVEMAIDEIKTTYENETEAFKKISLSLWRELPDLLKRHENRNEKVGELWDLLPADTRIPDHSIWDHRSVVSALAGAGLHQDNASLFLFTLGPVQDFIAASRKTIDLWSGSYLLAWLSWKAMERICDQYGPDTILFPNLYKQPLVDLWLAANQGLKNIEFEENYGLKLDIPSLPNRFMAILPDDEIDTIAEEVQNAVTAELKTIGEYAWNKNLFKESPVRELWEGQIENFIEFYWSSIPFKYIKTIKQENEKKIFEEKFKEVYGNWLNWDNDSLNNVLGAYEKNGYGINTGTVYGRLYNLLEHANGARKAVRDFKQVAEPGYRCTLIQGLGAMVPDKEIYPADFSDYWQSASKDNKAGIISESERMSAISLIKRHFPEYLNKVIQGLWTKVKNGADVFINDRYPSTHSIAGADYKLKIIEQLAKGNEELEKVLKEYIEVVNKYRDFIETKFNIPVPGDRALHKIKRTAGNCEMDTMITAGNFCTVNGEFLFEEGFTVDKEKEILQQDGESLASDYRNIQQKGIAALKKLYKKTDDLDLGRPSKYYAILHFDGDHMGKWLSGEKAPLYKDVLHSKILKKLERNQPEGWDKILNSSPDNPPEENVYRPLAPAIHAAISRALNFFTDRVRTIVEQEHLGKLIYAGGDDVLALVSLGDALKVAEKIRVSFTGHVDENGEVDWTKSSGYSIQKKKGQQYKFQNMGDQASGSAGIAIVHYMYPLQQGMKLAREAEAYAKEQMGRNAFAIAAAKRSGDTSLTGQNWVFPNTETPIMPYINKYLNLLREGYLSNSFVFDLEKSTVGLSGFSSNGHTSYMAHSAVISEIRRIFIRNSEKLRKKKGEDEQLNQWDEVMEPLVSKIPVQRLTQMFSILQFMIRGEAR